MKTVTKPVKAVIAVLITLLSLIMIRHILIPIYDAEETQVAIGQTYDLSEGWTVEYEDGEQVNDVSLPFRIETDKGSSVTLLHDVSEEYAGLALNFYASNTAMRMFIEGKPIFEAGYSDMGGAPDLGAIGEMGERDDRPIIDDTTSTKTAAGEITADLPSNISEGTMRITLNRVEESDIIVQYATVCKRDVAIINVLRDSMFPILCGLIILFICVILLVLDGVRLISGERMRGLGVIAFIGLLCVFFIILQTDLMKMFFGNKKFFNKLAMLIVTFIPVLIAWFYELGLSKNYFKQTILMMSGSILLTFGVLGLNLFGNEATQLFIKPLTVVLYLYVGVNILIILFRWGRQSGGIDSIKYDLLSITCFVFVLILSLGGEFEDHSQTREYIIDVLSVLTMLFILIQHANIVIAAYKSRVEKNAKALEEQVKLAREAKKEADTANEAKGKFLANMSHEIRTPINAVLGMDEMILRESREKNIREYAMDIHTAGQSLLSIINDILDMSKIESGKMEIIPVDYDTSSMIHDLSNMISFRAKAKNLKLEVSVDPEIPARLHGDDVRVKQVLTNILTNAVKYTEKGTVWFRVSLENKDNDVTLHFEVEDTGMGIKKEDMPKLFEAFQRIDESRNRNIEGTGLGMNITLQMLNLMGSKLEVESEYGKGSRFHFYLKQGVVDDTPLGDFEERIKKLEEQYVYSRAFIAPEARVLVVDDNAMNRKVFSALLKPTQITVDEAEGGPEAIVKTHDWYYDIIFMDHMMPVMDGIEAMHRIKAMEESLNKDTPILVLTANAVAGAKEAYLKEGFDGFLSKPIVSDKLEEAIREFLPEEKILPAPDDIEQEKEQSSSSESIDSLPMIDGLDWNIALLHLPGLELIESACGEFYKLISLHGDKLQKMYEGLPDSLDDYRIQVHGMKSSAASIGIIPLAGMAKVLEFAAKDGDIERIRLMHDIFIKEWLSYNEKLKGVFGLGEEKEGPKETLDKEALKVLIQVLKEAMEDMDIDGADEAVMKLSNVALPEDMAKDIPRLKGLVADLDEEAVTGLMDEWLSRL